MPIYEYRCPDCGHQFDRLQKLSEPAVTDCPSCGLANVRKLISRTSFTLKGSGWYADHYGLKSSGASESKSEGSGGTDAVAASAKESAAPAKEAASSSKKDAGASAAPASAPAKTSSAAD